MHMCGCGYYGFASGKLVVFPNQRLLAAAQVGASARDSVSLRRIPGAFHHKERALIIAIIFIIRVSPLWSPFLLTRMGIYVITCICYNL